MTTYQIVSPLALVAVDTSATISLSTTTNNFAGNKNITVLKIDNPDLTTTGGVTVSLSGVVGSYDADNSTAVVPGGTVFLQVAGSNNTGSVYVRTSGAGLYIQAVAIAE